MSGLDTNVFDFGDSVLEVATDVGIAGTTTAINTYGGAAINSWEGGFDFDNKTFNSMTSWENTMVSYISSMAGAGVTSTLDTGTFGYINDVKANADTLTGLAGGLTSSAVQYGMTGETTLNLASIYGTGFMEMHLGGDGPMFNFGMSGTDVSLGTLSSAYDGLDAFKQNRIIRKSGVDDRLTAGMRTLYSAKMDETTDLYNDIINGDAEFITGTGTEHDGKTTLNSDGVRMINLNMDDKDSLDLAVLMSHEAFRDGVTGSATEQEIETAKAALAHMSIGATLAKTYGGSSLNEFNRKEAEEYQEALETGDWSKVGMAVGKYDSSADYWKLMDDGSIVWDGEKDLTDENDNIIRKYLGEGGNTAALADHLGLSEDEARQLIVSAGIDDYKNGTFVDSDGNDVKLDKNFAIGMYNQFVRDGVAISYGDIYNSRVITDSTTGMTGTIFDHNPVNIYDKLVAQGRMEMDNTGVTDENGNWTGLQPRPISYKEFKANNYIRDPEKVMQNMAFNEPLGSDAPITSDIGPRVNPITGKSSIHTGYDYAADEGTPFHSLMDGSVSFIGWTDYGGNTLTMEHDMSMNFKGEDIASSFFTEYLHLQSQNNAPNVPWKVGDYLNLGQTAGYTGDTGPSTGAHLHTGAYFTQQNPIYNWLKESNYWNYKNDRGVFIDYGDF